MTAKNSPAKSRVLLSFNSAFRENAIRLRNELTSANITVFYDQWEGEGGVSIHHSSDIALGEVQVLILLISASDGVHSWIGKEWMHEVYDPAIDLGIKVLAGRVSHCKVPKFISIKSFADFAKKDYKHELGRLISAISKFTGDKSITLPTAQSLNRTVHPQEIASETILVLEFSKDMAPYFLSKDGKDQLGTMFNKMFDGLFNELGVQYPEVSLDIGNNLPTATAMLRVNTIPEGRIQLHQDEVLVNTRATVLQKMNINAIPELSPFNGASWAWIPNNRAQEVEEMGYTTYDFFGFLVLSLAVLLRKKAAAFITFEQTQLLLKKVERNFPILVQESVPKYVSAFVLTDVLRRLVSEGVSIRNMRSILHTLADWERVEHDPHFLTEYVRGGLKRQITQAYSRGTDTLVVILLDPEMEEVIRTAIKHLATGSYIDITPELLKNFLDAIKKPLQNLDENMQRPPILTTLEIRSCLRRLIANSLPHIHVLSYQEVRPEMYIQPLCRISWDEVTRRKATRGTSETSVWKDDWEV